MLLGVMLSLMLLQLHVSFTDARRMSVLVGEHPPMCDGTMEDDELDASLVVTPIVVTK